MHTNDPNDGNAKDDDDPKRWVIHGAGKQKAEADPEAWDGVDGVHQAMAGVSWGL